MAEIREECGVFGILPGKTDNAAETVYYGLFALQHRGQEGCGIAVSRDGNIICRKGPGLVSENFHSASLEQLADADAAIGHVRYGTTGGSNPENCQPIVANRMKDSLALVHNGNLVNALELRKSLEDAGAVFRSSSDTEIISYIINREALSAPLENALLKTMDILEGAYSLVLLSDKKILALRDKHGFRPLCYGQTPGGSFVVASESCALAAVGARFIRDVLPGEILVFEDGAVRSIADNMHKAQEALCVFEYIYFARPDSVIDGYSVHKARLEIGRQLSKSDPVAADVVIGVPDSGLDAALGYAEQSGIPYGIGFIKNRYIGRTFIAPEQNMRQDKIKIKLNPLRETVEGKRVILVDDSIVRGNTTGRIIKLLREAGTKEIHVRISSPPFISPCYYGTDIDSKENLVACHYTIPEIARLIGADSLAYLEMNDLYAIAGFEGQQKFCTSCFTGDYPTNTPENASKARFEQKV